MNVKGIILAGIVVWIETTVFGILTCGNFFNWVYQIEPIIWKSNEAILSPNNMIVSLALGLVSALLFTSVYAFVGKALPLSGVKKGLIFGLLVYLVGPLVGIAMMPVYMTIATAVVVYWLISQFVNYLIMGALVGLIYKEK